MAKIEEFPIEEKIEEFPVEGSEIKINPIIRQFFKGAFRETPFGKRVLSLSPAREKYYEETPPARTVPEQIALATGSLAGMLPSFQAGGFGGGAVGKKAIQVLTPKLGRAAKYAASIPAGATTFMGAKALRNIGKNEPITKELPEEAAMGAVFGPAGVIRSYPGAIATATTLGALTAPKGEKLASSILFGGLTAITHQRPDFSAQDRAQIDSLYNEAIAKEGARQVIDKIRTKALPAPETIYGETFTAKPSITRLPQLTRPQVTYTTPKLLTSKPTLEAGGIMQGGGFTVVGGKQQARALSKKIGYELRTTPAPEQTIAITQPQVTQELAQIRKPEVINGVVVTKGDIEAIPKPIQEFPKYIKGIPYPVNKPIPYNIKTPQIETIQTPTNFYAKIRNDSEWRIGRINEEGKFIEAKKLNSDKAISQITKSLKKITRSEEVIDNEGKKWTIIEGQGGFVDISTLSPTAEYMRGVATKIYRNIAPAGEVLRTDKTIDSVMKEYQNKLYAIKSGQIPTGLLAQRQQELVQSEKVLKYLSAQDRDGSVFVTEASNAIDAQRAFNKKFFDIVGLAEKIGITKGSMPAKIIFRALDYRRATPEEVASLTSEQQKFIPIFRNAYKEIWQATGKPSYEGIRDYATHLIQTGKEMGYDIAPLGRFLPDELYTRFFEKRRGGVPYKEDIVEAFDAYVPSISRKLFREPVLDKAKELLPYMDIELRNEAIDFMDAFLGRGRYTRELGVDVPKDLVRLTYQGTLFGNFSAATKNATQVLTNTIPEIGEKSIVYGYQKLMTPAGRQEFVNSQLAGDFTLGKPINQLDFFSQVEFVNRGVTYLGAKNKALLEGKSPLQAETYARSIVRKTQFIQTGVDVPKLYRQHGSVGRALGQFTQFPTKQGFLVWNWARNGQWNKVAKFATIAYLLGGTRTIPFLDGIINGDYKGLPQMPDDMKKTVKNVARYTSLAGLSGMDIGQNFGFGIYSSGIPFARGPVASTFAEAGRFAKGLATGEITSLQDVIRSRLVQKNLPTYIPGGVAIKKVIDLINLDLNDYKVRNAYNNLQYISTPKEETLRIFVGSTTERKEAWRSIFEEKDEADRYRNERRKMLDYTIDSKGDSLGLEEFMKKYPNYSVNSIAEDIMRRAKDRETPQEIRQQMRKPKALR